MIVTLLELWPSWLGQQNTPTASLQRSKTSLISVYDNKQSNSGAFGDEKYLFIAIATRYTVRIYPLAGPSPSQPPKPAHGHPIVKWFLSSPTQHIQLRVWKKRRTNKHGLGLAPSASREKFMTRLCDFLCIWLSRACIWAKFLHSNQERWLILLRWLTQPLGPQVLTPS